MSVTHVLNAKTGKSDRVMTLVGQIVLWSLQFNFLTNSKHLKGSDN